MTGTYSTPDGACHVRFGEHVVEAVFAECISAGQMETGGVLIGRYSDDNRLAVVVEATDPPSGSSATAVSFERSATGLAESLTEYWNKGLHYVGEWHYHPTGRPQPSMRDRKQMIQISDDPAYDCPVPILVVVGEARSEKAIQVWVTYEGQPVRLLEQADCPGKVRDG